MSEEEINQSWMGKVKDFLFDMFHVAYDKVKNFILGVYHHAESILILILSSVGLNVFLSEIPFIWSVPLWIEAPLVIPVISVLIILTLIKSVQWRSERRDNRMARVMS